MTPAKPGQIHEIRGHRIMLDRDVAAALEVETKHLNENAARSVKWQYLRDNGLEADFRFQLTKEEADQTGWSQSTTALFSNTYPFAYTRKGCAYFGTSMHSPAACAQAVRLVELFDRVHTAMDRYALLNPDFALRRHNAILEAAKFLSTIPGYNPIAVTKYVEQSMKDVQGEGITSRTLLDVQAYLMEKGMSAEQARKARVQFGKDLKAAYVQTYGKEPPKYRRFVEGAQRLINSYTEADRDLFDVVWNRTWAPLLNEGVEDLFSCMAEQ